MEKRNWRVRLYVDEVLELKNSDGQRWMYIGLLAIPDGQISEALGSLTEDRDDIGYYREIKSTRLTQQHKIKLAKKWLHRVMYDTRKCFHFYILGLRMDFLQRKAFGDADWEQSRRIYSRFFRSAVLYTLKSFFNGDSAIEVVAIFHDRTNMEQDDLFDWHAIWRITAEEPSITFSTDKIIFIESDHNEEKEYPDDSHFIQLIDLILGFVRQCLDCTSTRKGITEVATEFLPLVERLADKRRCNNPRSRYSHYRRCSLAFFPSKQLTLQDLEDPWKRARSSFFVERRLLLAEKLSGQQRLALGSFVS